MATVSSSEATNDAQYADGLSGRTGGSTSTASKDLELVARHQVESRLGVPARNILVGAPPIPPVFYQRVFDNGLSQYVYYTLGSVTASPDPGETTPNHSGSLDPSTHAIIEER